MERELLKFLFIGIGVPLFWGCVFWITRRVAPYLMTPVGVAFRDWRRSRRNRRVVTK